MGSDKLRKCNCQKHACTSTCEVKLESISPTEKLPDSENLQHSLKIENNNVKCESCSMEITENMSCVANCNVKRESDYKCEQCMKECQMAIMEMDKDSGIVIDDKLETDTEVKEELNDVVVIDSDSWKKPDYESTVPETVEEAVVTKLEDGENNTTNEVALNPKTAKRKLSLDSQADSKKKRKTSNKRTTSEEPSKPEVVLVEQKKKPQKRKAEPSSQVQAKKPKMAASNHSIMETIDNVIQQSLEMTQKRDKKTKKVDDEVGKKVKKAKPVEKVEVKSSVVQNPKNKVVAKQASLKVQKTKVKSKIKLLETKVIKVVEGRIGKEEESEVGRQEPQLVRNPLRALEDAKRPIMKKRKMLKKPGKKVAGKEECKVAENLSVTKRLFLKPKWSNGWSWEGEPYEAKVYLTVGS